MPRASKSSQQPTAKSEERRLIYAQFGAYPESTLQDWDPKPDQLVAAILQVVSDGATLVIRPGSGNRSIGMAIWEGDARHAPKWCYDGEELDEWAAAINRVHKSEAAD